MASVLTVPIPNDSEPYATLDLYEWTGSTWQFVPGHVVREDDTVLSELNRVPASFMVMQTNSVPPTAAAVVPEGQTLPDAGRDALTEVTPYGLSLQGDGSIQGNITAASNAGGSFGVAPVLRNWGDDGVVRTDLFENLLVSEELQQAHIEAIVNLVVGNNYPGIEIDYRGLDPTLSESYTAFIGKVADALHAKNKTLAVRVEAPTQIAEDRWSTGGYSWRDLSQVVDTFRIPALIDPAAYAPGGQMDSMLTWAVGEAPRHKIDLVLPARSVEKAGQYLILQGYDEALTPLLGESRTETPVLVPGEPVDISLINDRVIGGLSYDDKIGMFTYNYRDDAGYMRTVWIENAASIQKKLELINTYNLKGASFEHMLQESYDPDIWSVVREFLAGETSQRESKFAVRWQVTDPSGQVYQEDRPLDATGIKYTPPQGEGQIQVSANIVDNGKLLAERAGHRPRLGDGDACTDTHTRSAAHADARPDARLCLGGRQPDRQPPQWAGNELQHGRPTPGWRDTAHPGQEPGRLLVADRSDRRRSRLGHCQPRQHAGTGRPGRRGARYSAGAATSSRGTCCTCGRSTCCSRCGACACACRCCTQTNRWRILRLWHSDQPVRYLKHGR